MPNEPTLNDDDGVKMHKPNEQRVADAAAKLPSHEAAELMRKWQLFRALYPNEQLERMFAEHKRQRRG
ncbi:hypothetical protein BDD14_0189 [Edaphobacter modestus]|uniref:Uncharacterized protein n=2 Tax=Edaphobacter modestus TaxID=388466 RepID=A0A4Q7YMS6_9BACT|nr:hypothetical protein BDD14_0189 [Edaphobacter modestus]